MAEYSGSDFISQPVQEALDNETAARIGGVLPNGFTAQNKSTITTQGSSPNDIGLDISSYTKCLHVKSRNSTATWADDIAIGVSNINMNNAWNVTNGGQVYQQMGLTVATGGIFLDNAGDMNVTGGGRYLLNGEPVPFGGDVTLNGFQTLTNKTIRGNVNTITNLPISATTGLQTALDNEALTRSQGDSALQTQVDNKVSLFTASAQTITSGLNVFGNVNLTNGGEFQIDGVPIGGGGGGITASSVDTLTNKTMSGASNTFSNLPISATSGLQSALDNEALTRQNADTTLQNLINNKVSLVSGSTQIITNALELYGDVNLTNGGQFKINGVPITSGGGGGGGYLPCVFEYRIAEFNEGVPISSGIQIVPLNSITDGGSSNYSLNQFTNIITIQSAGQYEIDFRVATSSQNDSYIRAFFRGIGYQPSIDCNIGGVGGMASVYSKGYSAGRSIITQSEANTSYSLQLYATSTGTYVDYVFDPIEVDAIFANVMIRQIS